MLLFLKTVQVAVFHSITVIVDGGFVKVMNIFIYIFIFFQENKILCRFGGKEIFLITPYKKVRCLIIFVNTLDS